jgi:hypothetical protein
MLVYMLSLKEQKVLLELLRLNRVTKKDFMIKTKLFSCEPDFYKIMDHLGEMGFIHGSGYWELTWKGEIMSKMLALSNNNGKDYTKYFKECYYEFIIDPSS